MPALAVNIIIVHPWDAKTTPVGWTIMMFTLAAGITCIMLLKIKQYTIVAFIRGEHSNCLPEVGCLPDGRQPCENKQFGCSPRMMATIVLLYRNYI